MKNLLIVASFPNAALAAVAQSKLHSMKIGSVSVANERAGALIGVTGNLMPTDLLVTPANFEKAKSVLV